MGYNITQTFASQQYLGQAQYSIGYSWNGNANFTLGDFDKNGYIDIMSFPSNFSVTDGSYQFKPVVWLNNNGTFTATDNMAAGMTTQFARDIIIDDFNGDGYTDYIACDQGFEPNRTAAQAQADFKMYYPNLMLGTSNGLQFVAEQDWNKSYSTARVFNHIGDSADFDGDGDVDFAVAAFTDTFKLYVNNGDGTFTDHQDLINTTAGASGISFIKLGSKYAIVAGEYVGGVWDGKAYATDAPHVLEQVNGVFTDSYLLSKPVWNGQTLDMGMVDTENVDINNDGREDLLITWESSSDPRTFLSVYTQDASNHLNKKSDYLLTDTTQGATSSIETADLDRDGDLDFYVLQSGSNGGYKLTELDQAIWLNDGQGNFSHPTNFFNLTNYTSTRWEDKFGLYEMFDANNDGAVDVVAISAIYPESLDKTIGQEVTVFLNQSDPANNGTYVQNGTNNNDILQSLGGNNKVDAGLGNDTITLSPVGTYASGFVAYNAGSPGHSGSKETVDISGKNQFTAVIDGDNGTDTVMLTKGDDAFFLHDTYSAIHSSVATTTDSQGRQAGARVTAVEEINGGDGNDVIDLTSDVFNFTGVVLDGGNGNDVMWGNSGNDTLIGGAGNDKMYGGAGNDTFVLDLRDLLTTGNDSISDFTSGQDHIQISGGSYDHVSYNQSTGTLMYDSTVLAIIGNHATIAQTDFIFG